MTKIMMREYLIMDKVFVVCEYLPGYETHIKGVALTEQQAQQKVVDLEIEHQTDTYGYEEVEVYK